jgi:hypothetical protein
MRRLCPLVAVLALVLAGCQASNLERSAAVVVSGRVLQADGSPAGGVPVTLEREPTLGEVVTGLVVIPLTLFTACLAEPPAALCRGRSVDRATTTADGRYSFDLTGRDTQTAFGNARSFTLSTGTGEQSGAVVSASFRIQTEALVLPDLQLWQPAVTVAAGRIGWSPPADGDYQVVVEDTAGQPVWSFDSARAEVTFDPRLLEDTTGSLAVAARTSTTAAGTTVTIRRQSGRVAYRSAAGPPMSRGRPCTLAGTAAAVTPCPLTDGNFVNRIPPAPATSTTAPVGPTVPVARDAVTVDLGRPAEVSLIVVRGCSCDVERSTDGQAWTALGRASGLTALVPSRTGAARYIRLTGLLTDLHEVSVWEGTAGQAPPPPPGSPAAPAPAAPVAAAPTSPEPSRSVPALVALLLLVLAAVGTAGGALAFRRR